MIDLDSLLRALVAATGKTKFVEGRVVSDDEARAHAARLRTKIVASFPRLARQASANAEALLETWRPFEAQVGIRFADLLSTVPDPNEPSALADEVEAALDGLPIRFGTPAREEEVDAATRELRVPVPAVFGEIARAKGMIVVEVPGASMPVFEVQPVNEWEEHDGAFVGVRLGSDGNAERVRCLEGAEGLTWLDEIGRESRASLVEVLAIVRKVTGVVQATGKFPDDAWEELFDS